MVQERSLGSFYELSNGISSMGSSAVLASTDDEGSTSPYLRAKINYLRYRIKVTVSDDHTYCQGTIS